MDLSKKVTQVDSVSLLTGATPNFGWSRRPRRRALLLPFLLPRVAHIRCPLGFLGDGRRGIRRGGGGGGNQDPATIFSILCFQGEGLVVDSSSLRRQEQGEERVAAAVPDWAAGAGFP